MQRRQSWFLIELSFIAKNHEIYKYEIPGNITKRNAEYILSLLPIGILDFDERFQDDNCTRYD